MTAEPGWVEGVVWWHVYPLGFTGAVPAGGEPRGLAHLVPWLDYLVDLGASGLALGPVFASETHGYDTVDYDELDARLGDGWDALVDGCRSRGLPLLLDGVFNHVGRTFVRPELCSGSVFEGHEGLRTLDHARPEVADLAVDVMRTWLDRGASGWRLDAAYAVPASFWAQVLPRVRATHPEAWFVGEIIHGDYPATVTAATLDSLTQYELWKAVRSSLNDRNFFELAWALDRHNRALQTFAPMTFVGNHDVTRLGSALADERHVEHAVVLLLTLGGTPSLYYGDEQGFRGVKEDRAGGDDAVRPAFPAGPADLAPYGWPLFRLHQQLLALRRERPWLHRARTEVVHLANQQLVLDQVAGGHRLRVSLNLADAPMPARRADGQRVLAGSPGPQVPAHGWAVAG